MASLSDKISAVTAVFTAFAAFAAALSAGLSYQQTSLARTNQVRSERLDAFDKFTEQASDACDDFSFPSYDAIWDRKADDFKPNFDTTPLVGKNVDDTAPISLEIDKNFDNKINKLNGLTFQASRLIRLEGRGFDARPVDKFISDLSNLTDPLRNAPKQKDQADRLRYTIRGLHTAERGCRFALGELMKTYSDILPLD